MRRLSQTSECSCDSCPNHPRRRYPMIYSDCRWSYELSIPCSERPYRRQPISRTIEFLNPVISLLCDVDIALRVYRDSERGNELSIRRAAAAPMTYKCSGGSELFDLLTLRIRHIHVPARGHGYSEQGPAELTRAAPKRPPLGQECPTGVEYLHFLIEQLNDINLPIGPESNSGWALELTIRIPLRAPGRLVSWRHNRRSMTVPNQGDHEPDDDKCPGPHRLLVLHHLHPLLSWYVAGESPGSARAIPSLLVRPVAGARLGGGREQERLGQAAARR